MGAEGGLGDGCHAGLPFGTVWVAAVVIGVEASPIIVSVIIRPGTRLRYHRRAPVDAGRLVGIVTPTDITRALDRSTLRPHPGDG